MGLAAFLILCCTAPLCAQLRPEGVERPLINVREYGAVLDGVHDDSPAILAAFHAIVKDGHPNGTIYVPAGTAYIGSPLEFDLGYPDAPNLLDGGGSDRFSFVTDGTLMPKPGIGVAVRVRNGYGPVLNLRFFKGGSPTDVGLLLEGLLSPRIWVEARLFKGTAVEADASLSPAKRVRGISHLSITAISCGRALYLRQMEAFGAIEDVVDFNCTNGSYIGWSADITILHYENFSPATQVIGLDFDHCNGMHLGKICLGDRAKEALLRIWGGDFGYIDEIRVGGYGAFSPGSGIELFDVSSATIGHLQSAHCPKGLYIRGCGKITISTHQSLTSDDIPLYITAGLVFKTAIVEISSVSYHHSNAEAIFVDASVQGGRLVFGGDISYEQMGPSNARSYTIISNSEKFALYAVMLFKPSRSFLIRTFHTPDDGRLIHVFGGEINDWR